MKLFKVFVAVLVQKCLLIEAQIEKKFKRASSFTSEVDNYKLDEFLKHQHCTSFCIQRYGKYTIILRFDKHIFARIYSDIYLILYNRNRYITNILL